MHCEFTSIQIIFNQTEMFVLHRLIAHCIGLYMIQMFLNSILRLLHKITHPNDE